MMITVACWSSRVAQQPQVALTSSGTDSCLMQLDLIILLHLCPHSTNRYGIVSPERRLTATRLKCTASIACPT